MSPRAVLRELREDPDRLVMACIPLLNFAEAHAVHKRADKAELKAWRDSRMLALVQEFAFEDAARELESEE